MSGLAGAAAMVAAPRILSSVMVPTPRQTAGPFYPDRLPLDTDNDLLRINDADSQAYLHSESGDREQRDAGFQGYGRCITGNDGEYTFRTVKPVPYASRTPHIHFAVRRPGSSERFTTQMYVKGEPLNARDRLLNAIEDRLARDSVIVDFQPLATGSSELAARFDIVLGETPGA